MHNTLFHRHTNIMVLPGIWYRLQYASKRYEIVLTSTFLQCRQWSIRRGISPAHGACLKTAKHHQVLYRTITVPLPHRDDNHVLSRVFSAHGPGDQLRLSTIEQPWLYPTYGDRVHMRPAQGKTTSWRGEKLRHRAWFTYNARN